MHFEQTTLPNGLNIIAEISPDALSTAMAFAVNTGARDEVGSESGVSHFLEHMAFKGDDDMTWDDLNLAFDNIGASQNAYTSEEHTVYHAVVLPEYTRECLGLLARLLRPALRDADFTTEKKVILEEIGMYQDMPHWVAFERVMELHFGTHPVGKAVLGSNESITEMRAEQMRDYHQRRYGTSNMVLAVTGNIIWDQFVDWVAQACGHWNGAATSRDRLPPFSGRRPKELNCQPTTAQQVTTMLCRAPDSLAPLKERIASDVITSMLADSTGSIFYWELTEPGLVDSIEMRSEEFTDTGIYQISVGCSPELMADNLARVEQILETVMREGFTAQQFELTKTKIASRSVIAAERPRNRQSAIVQDWMMRHEYRTIEQDLADLKKLTLADVRETLEKYPLRDFTAVSIGPLEQLAGYTPKQTTA